MGHDHGTEPSVTHTHAANDCHSDLSSKYTDFIRTHLATMRERCTHFVACIDKLLADQSVIHILNGEDISLNKTCGLVHQDGHNDFSTLTGKCTIQERNDIRENIENHLEDRIASDGWKSVKKCLGNSYGDNERTTLVDEICSLAHDQKLLCNNYNTHKTVETFFNDQMHLLKCTCQSLSESDHAHVDLPIVIGAAVGGLFFLIILLLVCFMCYRRRRSQKKKKRSPNVIYLPAPNVDNCPVYQEVYDDRQYQAYRPTPSVTPPTLPMRYTPHPSAASNLSQGSVEEPAYLEPVEAGSRFRNRPRPPLPGLPKANPGYDAPPKYSERADPALEVREDENGYFQPLPSPTDGTNEDEDKGYDTLGRNKSDSTSPPHGYESVDGARSSLSSIPMEEAPVPVGPPLGPVPAKRTKKDDRQVESHYFELEKVEDNNATSS